MSIAIVADSNSGVTQNEARELGIHVLPMPFMINGEVYYEGIDLTHQEFYKRMEEGADITTSQPSPKDVLELWDNLLKEYDEIVYIPMSSGLSGSCQTAMMLADEYDGRVQVVNNQRISVTQRQSALDARDLAAKGYRARNTPPSISSLANLIISPVLAIRPLPPMASLNSFLMKYASLENPISSRHFSLRYSMISFPDSFSTSAQRVWEDDVSYIKTIPGS